MSLKIVCEVWKKPNADRMCEIETVTVNMDEILRLAVKKARRSTGWSDEDIYNYEPKHIEL